MLRETRNGPDAFFVSIDVSAIDPAEMVAAGRATANGMLLDDVRRTIRHVCATKEIVGFEITDLAPMLDVSAMSVMHSNAVLNACLAGVAVRKADCPLFRLPHLAGWGEDNPDDRRPVRDLLHI